MIFRPSFFPNLIFVNPGGRCCRKQRRQRPPVVAQPQTPKVFSLFRFSVFFRFPFFGVFGFFGVFRRSRLFSAFFGVLGASRGFAVFRRAFWPKSVFFFGESFVLLKAHMGSGGSQDFLVSARMSFFCVDLESTQACQAVSSPTLQEEQKISHRFCSWVHHFVFPAGCRACCGCRTARELFSDFRIWQSGQRNQRRPFGFCLSGSQMLLRHLKSKECALQRPGATKALQVQPVFFAVCALPVLSIS